MLEKIGNILAVKPQLGFAASAGSVGASILTWLQVINPVLGCIAVVAGIVLTVVSIMVKIRVYKLAGVRNRSRKG